MRPLLLRLLVLACGLLLALPPGWCCLLPLCPAAQHAAPVTAPAGPCEPEETCCCCGAGARPVPPPASPTPAPIPATCCPGCADRDVTAPDAVKPPVVSPDAAPVAALPAGPHLLSGASSAGPAADLGPLCHSTPLHVLHCVWLC